MLEDTKPAAKSLTIVSNVLTIGVLAAGATVARNLTPGDQQTIIETGTVLAGGVLQLVSIFGRMRATKRIG